MDRRHTNFPKHFFWGGSTAAHQVEGNNHNQWTVWELAHAKELAQTAHQRLNHLQNWQEIKDQAEEPENYISGQGVDHYRRYKEDFEIAKGLNLNAFRFTIEWSRLEPEEGKWDIAEFDHYKKYITELRKQKLEPFLTLWHWTLPQWFYEKDGFEKKENLKYFYRYVQKVADELLDGVEYVITVNEERHALADVRLAEDELGHAGHAHTSTRVQLHVVLLVEAEVPLKVFQLHALADEAGQHRAGFQLVAQLGAVKLALGRTSRLAG